MCVVAIEAHPGAMEAHPYWLIHEVSLKLKTLYSFDLLREKHGSFFKKDTQGGLMYTPRVGVTHCSMIQV